MIPMGSYSDFVAREQERERLEARLRLADEALAGPLGYWERADALEIRDRLVRELEALAR